MKRLLLALLATSNLVHAGVIMVDESTKITPTTASTAVPAASAVTSNRQPAPVVSASQTSNVSEIKTKPLVVAPTPVKTWSVSVGDKSVRSLLERWTKSDGYQLVWEISVDLELNANATMTGSFEDALSSVLASLKNSDYPIEAMIYDNKVVRMVKRTPRNT